MAIGEWMQQAQKQLQDAAIITARLDSLVLLEDQTGHERAWLLAHPEHILQGSELKMLNTKIVQRAAHIPLAYIRGKAEFYGREFAVNEHTLVPRPETETMIELLKRLYNKLLAAPSNTTQPQTDMAAHPQNKASQTNTMHLIDIGTGSGAIAITAKLEIPTARVTASDIDERCLKTAAANARALGAAVSFVHGSLMEPFGRKPSGNVATVLLCNLPYVPKDSHINTAATHEPAHAIFGGSDGLDLYRTMFAQTIAASWQPQYVLAESLPTSHAALADIAKVAGYQLVQTDDFIQLFSH